MKNNFSSFIVGFIFALGLGISGMTDPNKVIGFLNIFDQWDPSLMFVMIGSITIHSLLFGVIRKKKSPLFSPQWHLPTKKHISPDLVVGSFVFGIGWGLAGYCPGPAVTSLASLRWQPLLFVASMMIGMLCFKVFSRKINKLFQR